jgi:TRAP transporter 4TM/12TM fusion protein
MERLLTVVERSYLAAIVVIGIAWILDLPQFAGVSLIAAEWIGPMIGIAIAAALLHHPYHAEWRWLDAALGLIAIASWVYLAVSYSDWIIDISGYTPAKVVPAVAGLLLLMEGMRKSAGLPITLLVWALIGYALFGYLMPGPFSSRPLSVPNLVMYLYADTNGVPGLVMVVVGTLVLAFIVLGRVMEVSGAIRFFTDLALSFMGARRGGPAKVAVVASSVFGSINGTAIGNIMSTGIVTIPLMKQSGFKPKHAAAIEAVASNGGQFAPPVMGATAFLIAEFLQVSYSEVVLAALVPAVLYYVCLFIQVDAIAVRFGLHGLPRSELPRALPLLRGGWVFLLPLGVLIYLLFGRNLDPGWSALAAALVLLILGMLRQRRLLSLAQLREMVLGAGESMLPLIMIAGGAGIVIGVMNITGLGFSLSVVLSQIGEQTGLLAMLLMTAAISIVLGMGMPTTAIYVVLSVVLAPALVEMGIAEMSAHLFIFYFGLLSFLTPPVAIASYVAAGLAGSGMWSTSWEGVKLAAMAYLLPILWCYNGALLLEGSPLAIGYAIGTALVAAALMARALQNQWPSAIVRAGLSGGLALIAIAIGGSTVWFGQTSPINIAMIVAGGALVLLLGRRREPAASSVV